jgi:DNA-binding winged helix-turn-helix (wHTH) protein
VSSSFRDAESKSAVARFGTFEVDLEARELRKSGRRLRLQDQPFAVLAILLERSGEIVSREELRQRVWPADTFVDFDHSLNTAVNKVREALDDAATNPQFVETVPRRGYRFLAELHWQERSIVPTTSQPAPAPAGSEELPAVHRGISRSLFALIQVMYLVFYSEALVHWKGVEQISWYSGSPLVLIVVVLTAGVGIPLRFYFLSASGFDYRLLGEKFRKLFIPVLALDELWAVAPFLIIDRIGFGAAFAATAALLYVPFAERTLVRMAYERSHLNASDPHIPTTPAGTTR